jgi:hypothetical protein
MTASWAEAIVAAIVATASGAYALARMAWRRGKLDAILEQLTAIAADHEKRLREQEHR